MTDLPLHVVSRGRGRPLVMVHGFGASSFTWRHWTPTLAEEGRVVEVDLKGFGEAPAPRDHAYSPLDQARLVRDLVLEEVPEPAVLVGHSLGAAVVLAAALDLLDRDPASVAGIVVVAGACYPQEIPRFISLARIPLLGAVLLRLLPKRALVRWILAELTHDPDTVTPGQIEGYARPLRRPGTRHAIIESARRLLPPGADEVLSRYREIDVPALLLWGRQDPVVPLAAGRRLREELPRARLEILEECGHVVPDERPRESLERVREFLREL